MEIPSSILPQSLCAAAASAADSTQIPSPSTSTASQPDLPEVQAGHLAAGRGEMMNLRRRVVNLVAENYLSSVCSLHRLDVQHLFYPSTAEADAAKPAVFKLPLPAPTYNFQPAVAGRNIGQHLFGLANTRISESRILWRSQEGNTFLYDADSHTSWSMPSGLDYMGKRPIVISAPVPGADADGAPGEQEDLFVMCSECGYLSFQVLRFDHSKAKTFKPRSFSGVNPIWQWERLPPPPLSEGSSVHSHAVLNGGRIICVSVSPFGGTYLFDTVRREWMRQANSDWPMPFFGAPQYVPDINLWLGVHWSGDEDDDSDRHHLCASLDLGGAVDAAIRGADRPSVTLTHHWEEGLETPVGWETAEAQLLDLGDGRFCIAKFIFEVLRDDYADYQSIGQSAALLTGVEMVRGAGDGCRSSNPSSSSSSSEDGFRMVVHKSLRYIFCQESIKWVL